MELKDYKHPYYCSNNNFDSSAAGGNYSTMTGFLNEFENVDIDTNLMFRWDLKNHAGGGMCATVFIINQHKGILAPYYVASVTGEELSRFEEYARRHWQRLQEIWHPLSGIDYLVCGTIHYFIAGPIIDVIEIVNSAEHKILWSNDVEVTLNELVTSQRYRWKNRISFYAPPSEERLVAKGKKIVTIAVPKYKQSYYSINGEFIEIQGCTEVEVINRVDAYTGLRYILENV